jgi:hypothetical protein
MLRDKKEKILRYKSENYLIIFSFLYLLIYDEFEI